MKKQVITLICSLSMFWTVCSAGDQFSYKSMPSMPEAKDTLVGVNFFNGWWPETPNKYEDSDTGADWRKEFPERISLCGEYNNQEVMTADIKAASDYGVDFFQILWYYIDPNAGHGLDVNPVLNMALDDFTNSPNSALMDFCIEFCNHEPFRIKDFKTWDESIDIWLKYMKHPSYLRIDDRPVFKVHGAGRFRTDAGGDEDAKKWVDHFRKRVKDAGLGDLLIGCGNSGSVWETHWAWEVFEFTNEYNHIPQHPADDDDYKFIDLATHTHKERGSHRFDKIGHIPHVVAGWNPRPWKGHSNKPSFKSATRSEWIDELKRVVLDYKVLPNMGIKLKNGQRQKIFTIYAWNEYGEGGIVAPTQGEGYMKLEGIKEVFGVKK